MKRLRRLAMGLETVLGLRRRGVFIPYRYAGSLPARGDYPAVEALFRAHEAGFAAVLDAIDARAAALAALDGPPPRPRWGQSWFPRLDGAALMALLGADPPRRVVEVGSGHSTRFLAEAAPAASILCIDPAPRAALPPGVEHRAELLGPEHAPLFAALAPGDVAFFDSSHLLLPHGDVDLILTRLLPALRPGVRVHVHDVFLPDAYPEAWAWRGYAEQVGLAPWLLSRAFRPLWSSRWAASRMEAGARPAVAALPLVPGALETSLWMEKA